MYFFWLLLHLMYIVGIGILYACTSHPSSVRGVLLGVAVEKLLLPLGYCNPSSLNFSD